MESSALAACRERVEDSGWCQTAQSHRPERHAEKQRRNRDSQTEEEPVHVQVSSGFLNYINGYMAKSSDCVDFSAKEYSEADGEGRQERDGQNFHARNGTLRSPMSAITQEQTQVDHPMNQ